MIWNDPVAPQEDRSVNIVMIVAMDRNRLIGADGGMPWHLPGDLRRFRLRTMGRPVVMGRRTWESIGRPLPGRSNIVMSRAPRPVDVPAEVFWVDTVDGALNVAEGCPRYDDEVAIIGGAEIYSQFADRAVRLVLTTVEAELVGNVWLPSDVLAKFGLVESEERYPADDRNAFPVSVREMVAVLPGRF